MEVLKWKNSNMLLELLVKEDTIYVYSCFV